MAVLTVALVAGAGLTVVAAQADVVWPPTPTQIPGSPSHAKVAQVASLGGNGDAVAVWDSCKCSSAGVQAATFDGTNWSGTQTISNGSATDAFEPQVAAMSPGHAIAVWTENDGTNLTVHASTYGPNGWSTPVLVSGTDFLSDTSISPLAHTAARADGTAVAVWVTDQENVSGNTDIAAATFDGTTWSAPTRLSDSGVVGDLASPDVAVTGATTAVAVWEACGCHAGAVQASTLDGATWTPSPDLSDPSHTAFGVVVTATGGGAAVVAWVDTTPSPAAVQATSFDGTNWSGTIEPVSDPGTDVFPFPVQVLAITSTRPGLATVAWSGLDSSSDSVLYAAQRAAGTWTQVALSPPAAGGLANLTPDLTTIEPGVALAVWQSTDISSSSIQAATYDGSTVVGPANIAVTGVAPLFALPQVAATGEGTAVTVWTGDDGVSTSSIQAALGAPSAVTKPVPAGNATISTSAGGFLHVKNIAVPKSPAPPAGVAFPYGLFGFDIVNLPSAGATATVTVTLPAPVTQYWKLQDNAWTQLTNATFAGNHVTFTLTDGGTGDADHVANGRITDPGGPGVGIPPPSFTG